ncbi:hypothetical protein CKN82_01155 [Carnobacterium divergens]|uniref:LPXTG cell wall anchor domain-containing protein n=2 Tax=Carnobacterium divergens TaxID=2748 RepID=UPI001072299F|nr:hypothetical protein CKN59_01150 [Carnobacterium divergens]TFI69191.1 hypothetical protein CKN76_01150 [Carnobacterium divergens]TFI72904.1 hypothetical protein CKN70_01155 [Carnobacterium divergens]TFI84027.1 hypothetical protein CKN74_01150 [Carnobacterium divergens]TFI85486.1 hypothetical protein CKN68_01155 [Carnobacterium divergens]
MKKKHFSYLFLCCTVFSLLLMNQSVYGETIEINRETSIPVIGILTTQTEDEANEPSENNEEENTLTDQETIIKDNEIHHLPQTSELSQLHWILIGIASISVVLYLFNKKKR